jgi:phosphodiesterase/alkaline phosphatase D-like protein
MNKLLLKLAMVVTVCSLIYSTPAATQVSPTANKAARVLIMQGPEIERADPDFAIIRWTSNNPGGSPEHYGIVRYGTDPTELNQTAKSPIRLNPGHSYTVFRVRLDGLKPRTTYYYTVDSTEANGKGDGVKSAVKHFTTPG